MQDDGTGGDVDQPVETLPALAQAPLPTFGGSDGQREQQEPGGEAHQDIELFAQFQKDEFPVEKIVEAHKDGEVQGSIQEGVESQPFAQGDQVREAKVAIDRRYDQGQYQEDEGGFTGALGDLLNGVGREIIDEEIVEQEGQGQQGQGMD